MFNAVIVLTTVPSPDVGAQLARALVEAGLAACVNVLPPMTSIYRWKGVVHEDLESQLVIKTVAPRVEAIRTLLHEQHPYDLPEFLVLQVEDGDPVYLAWLADQAGGLSVS